jgi:sugar phosphate isomerase/epimerase
MKLALGSWAFSSRRSAADPWPFDKVIEYAAGAQYDGIEISGFRPHPHPDDFDTPQKCRELLKAVKGRGLGISGYAPDLTHVPPAEVATADYMYEIHKCLDFCTSCGIETLRVDTVSPTNVWKGVAYDRRLTRLVETWRATARAAHGAGVLIVWEFEPGFWLYKPSEVKRVVEAVEDESFKVLLDTGHSRVDATSRAMHDRQRETLESGAAQCVQMLREYIGHLHLSDPDGTLYSDETGAGAHFGEGEIDLRSALSSIRQTIDSLPWWCVDLCFNTDIENAGRAAVPIVHRLMADTRSE